MLFHPQGARVPRVTDLISNRVVRDDSDHNFVSVDHDDVAFCDSAFRPRLQDAHTHGRHNGCCCWTDSELIIDPLLSGPALGSCAIQESVRTLTESCRNQILCGDRGRLVDGFVSDIGPQIYLAQDVVASDFPPH